MNKKEEIRKMAEELIDDPNLDATRVESVLTKYWNVVMNDAAERARLLLGSSHRYEEANAEHPEQHSKSCSACMVVSEIRSLKLPADDIVTLVRTRRWKK